MIDPLKLAEEIVREGACVEGESLYHTAEEWRVIVAALRGTDGDEAPSAGVDDLAMLVRRLAKSLKIHQPNSVLAAGAMDYLQRHGLKGAPLREDASPQSAPQASPAGWKLVPVEPTEEMVSSGAETINRKLDDGKQAAVVYRYMLAAAPPAPGYVNGEPVAWGVRNADGKLHSLTETRELAERNAKMLKQILVPLCISNGSTK